ncbi:hypothetical protein Zmor_001189 [Zophobas morio]|uniref:Uncharacterized protein n=2 Tax=Zophobas morio TaxID=2755281 RepID=A0AA38J1J2_9CUCU|nr:hypothetical protein Zmor_001189 [Zophobas morio]
MCSNSDGSTFIIDCPELSQHVSEFNICDWAAHFGCRTTQNEHSKTPKYPWSEQDKERSEKVEDLESKQRQQNNEDFHGKFRKDDNFRTVGRRDDNNERLSVKFHLSELIYPSSMFNIRGRDVEDRRQKEHRNPNSEIFWENIAK